MTIARIALSAPFLSSLFLSTSAFAAPEAKPAPAPAVAPAPTPAPAVPASKRVAIMDLRTLQDNDELAKTMTDLVAFELEEGGYTVITREDIKSAVKLRGIQQAAGCETDACQGELASAVDVENMVTGAVGRLGSRFVLVLKLMDVKKVGILKQAKQVSPANEDALLDAVSTTARFLAGTATKEDLEKKAELEKKPEPAKADVVAKVEPAPLPAKVEPAPEPAKVEPAKADVVAKVEPAKVEPGPMKPEPAPEPKKADVVAKNDGWDTAPAKKDGWDEPKKDEPRRDVVARNEPNTGRVEPKPLSKPFQGDLAKFLKPIVVFEEVDEETTVRASMGSVKLAKGEKAITKDAEKKLSQKLAQKLAKRKAERAKKAKAGK